MPAAPYPLNIFSFFAVAFSYISPATGIFTLFILGIGTPGGAFSWTGSVVWTGQFIVALAFAEVSTHLPLAGRVGHPAARAHPDARQLGIDGIRWTPPI